ncbi:MAG: GxxExxY protein [Coraliomargaritaceae bacterium]
MMGLEVDSQKEAPLLYKGHDLEQSFRMDLKVEDSVVVELKAVPESNPVIQSQLLTCLRLIHLQLGLLLHFGNRNLSTVFHLS